MDDAIHTLVKDIKLPRMVKVRQIFDDTKIKDIRKAILEELNQARICASLHPGMRIAITGSSRGITNQALIIKTIVEFLLAHECHPFVVPAMGSHGGAIASEQTAILNSYGITEEYIGCPIVSSMETKLIGYTPKNQPVYIDKNAADADGIILQCRIAPHTSFRGPYESGIMKMMTIGLGKQNGASHFHSSGIGNMAEYIPMYGNTIRTHSNVLFAVASIENAYHDTCKISAVLNDEIPKMEPELLEYAKEHFGKILIDKCDVLVVDEIGKDINGDGADPNVTGLWTTKYGWGGLDKQMVVYLDLSEKTHGQAMGMGLSSFITRKLFNKVNIQANYTNAITSHDIPGAFIPIVAENDEDAIKAAVFTCVDIDYSKVEIIHIINTMKVGEIWISESLLEKNRNRKDIEVLSEPMPFAFDGNRNLIKS